MGDGLSSVCVPERSPVAIADAVEGLLTDPDRYRRMSEATADTWSKLVCPVTYYELIRRWAAAPPMTIGGWPATVSLQAATNQHHR